MKQTILFTLILTGLALGYHAGAQPLNRSTPEKLLKSAREAESTGNPYEALELYQKVYEETKDKGVAVKIALLNYELRDYEQAERRLERIVTRDRKKEYTDLKYYLGMSLKHNGKYQESIDMFNQYLTDGRDSALLANTKREIAGAELARKAKQPENLLVNNAGKKVNTPQTEASPVYSGGELYYTSLNAKEVITLDGKEGDWYAKVYTSSKSGPAEFGDPTPLGTQINREGWHQGNVSISPDGRTMYFTRIELENNVMKTSQIYYASKGADGWGAAKEVAGISNEYVAKHPCEGELYGEKVLFFAAQMPGGKGGYDLYYATKKGDGVFDLPINLGDVINTPGDEVSPFYRDGKLFFSTNGRETFGGLDVFESQWNGSVWSAPKGLPMGINSSLDDQYYTQSPDGMSGFLVSNRPGPNNLKSKTCCDDIYAWELERVKVNLAAKTYTFKRKNEKENPALTGCNVQVIDVTDKNPANVDNRTNPSGNDFSFVLQPEKSYIAIATRDGYYPDTVKVNTVGVKKSQNVERKFTLRAIKKEPDSIIVKINEPIVLNSIYYDFNDDKILPDAEKDLQFLVDLMNRYPEMKIELSSHTDSRGKDEYNEALSQRRAESAKRWIVAKGIKDERIVAKGYGEKQLRNACANGVECDEEQHRLNRRTEFKIIAGPTSITIERKERRPVEEEKPKGRN
ncbi:MAG: OmpA family protein [Saprospiraceae bacterium]|nr:OmpA family protein [Saprospiraceae bacterium]